MAAPTPDSYSAPAMDLMAQMVDANVKSLAWTTDRIIEGIERERDTFAQTIVEIDRILQQATVVDRATETRLRMLDGLINNAYDHLERKGAHT